MKQPRQLAPNYPESCKTLVRTVYGNEYQRQCNIPSSQAQWDEDRAISCRKVDKGLQEVIRSGTISGGQGQKCCCSVDTNCLLIQYNMNIRTEQSIKKLWLASRDVLAVIWSVIRNTEIVT